MTLNWVNRYSHRETEALATVMVSTSERILPIGFCRLIMLSGIMQMVDSSGTSERSTLRSGRPKKHASQRRMAHGKVKANSLVFMARTAAASDVIQNGRTALDKKGAPEVHASRQRRWDTSAARYR